MIPRSSMPNNIRESMISIFKRAIPEIDPEAEIHVVFFNPWRVGVEGALLPEHEPRDVPLHKYDIPGPNGSRYSFTIAYLPEPKIVLALEILPHRGLIEHYTVKKDSE